MAVPYAIPRAVSRGVTRAGTDRLFGGTPTGALRLLYGESQGLAFDFAGTTPSAVIRDTTTPANNYTSSGTILNGAPVGPGGKLTYSSPSPKLCLQSTGYYAHNSHNLYLNSAAPANQAITVTSGCTYAIVVTGSVSITWSGAYVGTTTAGTTNITAASGTLTGGSTSGSGTVAVYKTPCVGDYIATTGSAVYSLPYEWNTSAVPQGVRVEEARVNYAFPSQPTVAQAATSYANGSASIWGIAVNPAVASTTTVDPFGTQNALRLTWSGTQRYGEFQSNTAYQIPDGTNTACISIWMRAVSGTVSDITLTLRTTVAGILAQTTPTLTTTWQRVTLTAAKAAGNGTCGWYLEGTASSSVIEIIQYDFEVGNFATSSIITGASTVSRAGDQLSIVTTAYPHSATAGTAYASMGTSDVSTQSSIIEIGDTSGNERLLVLYHRTSVTLAVFANDGGAGQVAFDYGAAQGGTAFKTAARYALNDYAAVLNGSAAGTDTVATLATATKLFIGTNFAGTGQTNGYIKAIMYLPRAMSNTELQTVTT